LLNKRREKVVVMDAQLRKSIARMANAANPEESRPEPLRKKRVVQDVTHSVKEYDVCYVT
jgi:Mrp family chromosome partitioning ATPase